MTEDYLHYCWKYKLFDNKALKTSEGEELEIINFGFHNHDSGPDFSQGKVKIGNTIWAGNIEIHLNSSDWMRHNHQKDKAYDSVILHVVYNHDQEIELTGGDTVPVLELKTRLDYTKYQEYEQFIFRSLPCISQLSEVPNIIISSTLDAMLVDRLKQKTELLKRELEACQNNWNQVFFQQLAKSMGLKVNANGMEEMSKNTSILLFDKLGNNKLAIESILFGQSGFLDENREGEAYYSALKKEYEFHKTKNSLVSINKQSWKFSKMRPSNFPTLRLAQLAELIAQNSSLFDLFIQKEITVETIYENLNYSIENGFWYTHYTFDTESKPKKKSIGKTMIDSIIINTIAPFMYVYGMHKDEKGLKEKALQLLEELKPEDNKITRLFGDEIKIENAAHSQGLINCYKEYCVPKKCLDCSIGIYLLKN
ncbi:MAG: DUF2851 family protein [Flavobacteriales bacterium]